MGKANNIATIIVAFVCAVLFTVYYAAGYANDTPTEPITVYETADSIRIAVTTTEAYTQAESTTAASIDFDNLPIEEVVIAVNAMPYDFAELAVTVEPVEVEAEAEWISLGEFTLTAFCPCVKCCGIWSGQHPSRKGTDYIQKTASGTIPTQGRTIGVNTALIPFGTVVLINGHEYIAEDTGGAAKRNKYLVDIFMSDHNSAIEFGRKKAEVFVKK